MRAAVYVQHLSGDMARFREIDHRICDFFHRPGTRLHPLHLRERLYHARIAPREVGVDGTRRYRVDSNTVAVAELFFFFSREQDC